MAVEVRFGEGHVSAARVRTLNGIRNRWRSAKRCAALPEDRRGRNPSRSEGFVPNGNKALLQARHSVECCRQRSHVDWRACSTWMRQKGFGAGQQTRGYG